MSAPMTSANSWTIAAARDALRKGEISAVDLTMSCLTAIDAADGLNAFVHKTPEIALEQARALDKRRQAGLPIPSRPTPPRYDEFRHAIAPGRPSREVPGPHCFHARENSSDSGTERKMPVLCAV